MNREAFKLERCSWDITDRCMLSCSHCCAKRKEVGEELSTDEAMDIIEQLSDMNVKTVCLTGGEPLLREDWALLAKTMFQKGIEVSMITNGWLIDENTAEKIRESKIHRVGVSLDGTEEIHDKIRCKGSYVRGKQACINLQKCGLETSVITTVMSQNIENLPNLRTELMKIGIPAWQLQIGIPVGNMAANKNLMIQPSQVDQLIDFSYETAQYNRIRVFPADCIGYYTKKETYVRKQALQSESLPVWRGCIGGRKMAHITSEGCILGVSMAVFNGDSEDKKLRSLRVRPLREIWEDDRVFRGFRDFDSSRLEGVCGKCQYREMCRGGCTMLRSSVGGRLYAENEYCAYSCALKRTKKLF